MEFVVFLLIIYCFGIRSGRGLRSSGSGKFVRGQFAQWYSSPGGRFSWVFVKLEELLYLFSQRFVVSL